MPKYAQDAMDKLSREETFNLWTRYGVGPTPTPVYGLTQTALRARSNLRKSLQSHRRISGQGQGGKKEEGRAQAGYGLHRLGLSHRRDRAKPVQSLFSPHFDPRRENPAAGSRSVTGRGSSAKLGSLVVRSPCRWLPELP